MADKSGRPTSATAAPPLVGREREQAALRDALAAALGGRGALVLIGGEAGIGKTTLAEWLLTEAAAQGALVLVGRCYDLAETPPYGPWNDALVRAPRGDSLPVPPKSAGGGGEMLANQGAIIARAAAYLAALADARPLVLLLDDLHWADPASLDLLRVAARDLAGLPLLLLVTYRADELARHHPLYALLPLLVREARAVRVDLYPLEARDLAALVRGRYALPTGDEARLVGYLRERAEGNPLYVGELLRTLEERRTLRRGAGGAGADAGWHLADLAGVGVPALLRQVIDARVDRLGEEARDLLAVAAIIGQEVPLALWSAVAGVAEAALPPVIARAAGARVLEELPDGARARFVHALIREALYDGVAPSHRRALHRRVAAALLAAATGTHAPDPDAVASHLGRAGDPRAAEWLVRAGLRARRADAWLTAAARFAAAAATLADEAGRDRERGWLLFASGVQLRFADSAEAIRLLDEAERAALAAGDRALIAYTYYHRSISRYIMGAVGRGLAELRLGVAALDTLPADYHRWSSDGVALTTLAALFPDAASATPLPVPRLRVGAPQSPQRGVLVGRLGQTGHYREAIAMGEAFVATMVTALGDSHLQLTPCLSAYMGLSHAYAALGRPVDARRTLALARRHYAALGESAVEEYALWVELLLVALPYRADDRTGRTALAADAARAWRQAKLGSIAATHASPTAPLLALLEGHWDAASQLAEETLITPILETAQGAIVMLAALARRRGDLAAAWARVREVQSAGPETAPGDCDFHHGVAIQAVAVELALDAGDLPTARSWLAAHARWLAWSGAVLWRAEHRLLRARLAQAAGHPARARHHAAAAARLAAAPRQPLALLAARRLQGELATDAGHHAEAATHLDAALALAEACAAPYERALTLLALAELRAARGSSDDAQSLLTETRAILESLGAAPALARAAALAARLAAPLSAAPVPTHALPFGLTAREAAVLRLLAEGLPDAQIAARLFVSRSTVATHTRAIFGKLGVNTRTAAARLATAHGLA